MAGRIVKGVSWSAVQQFSTQGIQFVISIILARILTPEEFGVVAAAMIVLVILQVINETGFGAALLQKLDRDETDFFSVFILNIVMGVVLYGILYLSAPLIAQIFGLSQLTTVVRLLGINLLISSFIVVQRTKLLIQVDFKTWTIASVSAALLAGIISIIMAYNDFGVYALVVQSILSSFFSCIFIWWLVKWHPNWQFSLRRLKSLFQFAYKLIAARLINTVFNEIYSSVIAIVFNPTQLAFFNRANSFQYMTSVNIVSIVQRVAVPVMCEHQNSETELRNLTIHFIKNTSFFIIPLAVLLFTLAKPLIICLLTEDWLESAAILQAICLIGFFYNISAFNMNIFNATGRTDLALKCEIVKKTISVLIIAIAVISKDFNILVWSYIVTAIIECLINIAYTHSQIHASFVYQVKPMLSILGCAVLSGGIIEVGKCFITNPYIQLFGLGTVGILSYLGFCYIWNICDTRIIIGKLHSQIRHTRS